eukprot:scpid94429/ scgid3666/ 
MSGNSRMSRSVLWCAVTSLALFVSAAAQGTGFEIDNLLTCTVASGSEAMQPDRPIHRPDNADKFPSLSYTVLLPLPKSTANVDDRLSASANLTSTTSCFERYDAMSIFLMLEAVLYVVQDRYGSGFRAIFGERASIYPISVSVVDTCSQDAGGHGDILAATAISSQWPSNRIAGLCSGPESAEDRRRNSTRPLDLAALILSPVDELRAIRPLLNRLSFPVVSVSPVPRRSPVQRSRTADSSRDVQSSPIHYAIEPAVGIVRYFQWQSVIIVSSQDVYDTAVEDMFAKQLDAVGVCVAHRGVFHKDQPSSIERELQELSNFMSVRVVILIASGSAARTFFGMLLHPLAALHTAV